jgi:hypothetical protein
LGHSFETGWNKHDHSYIIQNKSNFYHRMKF